MRFSIEEEDLDLRNGLMYYKAQLEDSYIPRTSYARLIIFGTLDILDSKQLEL